MSPTRTKARTLAGSISALGSLVRLCKRPVCSHASSDRTQRVAICGLQNKKVLQHKKRKMERRNDAERERLRGRCCVRHRGRFFCSQADLRRASENDWPDAISFCYPFDATHSTSCVHLVWASCMLLRHNQSVRPSPPFPCVKIRFENRPST